MIPAIVWMNAYCASSLEIEASPFTKGLTASFPLRDTAAPQVASLLTLRKPAVKQTAA
jgi:hypothetical protein